VPKSLESKTPVAAQSSEKPSSSSERSMVVRVSKILLFILTPANLVMIIAVAAERGSATAVKIRDKAKAIKDKTAEQLGKMFGALKRFLPGIKFSDDDRKDGFTAFDGVFGGGGGSIRHPPIQARIQEELQADPYQEIEEQIDITVRNVVGTPVDIEEMIADLTEEIIYRIHRIFNPYQRMIFYQAQRDAILLQDRQRLQIDINQIIPLERLERNRLYRVFNIYLGNGERNIIGRFIENLFRGNGWRVENGVTTVYRFVRRVLFYILADNEYRTGEWRRSFFNDRLRRRGITHEEAIRILRELIEEGAINIEFYPGRFALSEVYYFERLLSQRELQEQREEILRRDRERLQVDIDQIIPLDRLERNRLYRVFNIYLGNEESDNLGEFVENLFRGGEGVGNGITTVYNFVLRILPYILIDNRYRTEEWRRSFFNDRLRRRGITHEEAIRILRELTEEGAIDIEFFPGEFALYEVDYFERMLSHQEQQEQQEQREEILRRDRERLRAYIDQIIPLEHLREDRIYRVFNIYLGNEERDNIGEFIENLFGGAEEARNGITVYNFVRNMLSRIIVDNEYTDEEEVRRFFDNYLREDITHEEAIGILGRLIGEGAINIEFYPGRFAFALSEVYYFERLLSQQEQQEQWEQREEILRQDRERLRVYIDQIIPLEQLRRGGIYRVFNIYLGNEKRNIIGEFIKNFIEVEYENQYFGGNGITVYGFVRNMLPCILIDNEYRNSRNEEELRRFFDDYLREGITHEEAIGILGGLIGEGAINIEFYPIDIPPQDPTYNLTRIPLENLDYDTIYNIEEEAGIIIAGIMRIVDLLARLGIEYDPNEDFQANIDRNRDALLRYRFYPTEQIPADIDQINTIYIHRETDIRGNLLFWLKRSINPYRSKYLNFKLNNM